MPASSVTSYQFAISNLQFSIFNAFATPLEERSIDMSANGYQYVIALFREDDSPLGQASVKVDWGPAEEWAKFQRSEEHTSELQSRQYIVCRLLLEKKKQ